MKTTAHAAPSSSTPHQPSGIGDEQTAARYLTLSVSYLRKHRRLGTGPRYLRFGRAIRYRFVDLDEYCASRRVQ